MAETNLSISRVENGFVIEDYRPADCGFKGTVLVAETSTGLAALVAAWAAQFEPDQEPITMKTDIVVDGRLIADTIAKPPIVVREHGIYEQRDGTIVGPMKRYDDVACGIASWSDEAWAYRSDGSWSGRTNRGSDARDLVREIVVGEGWKPWNGGEKTATKMNERVDIITRQISAFRLEQPVFRRYVADLRWSHEGKPDDILAYRLSTEG